MVRRTSLWLASCVLLLGTACHAQDASEAHFQRGYFLEHHDRDYSGAVEAYERVLAADETEAALRAEAQTRLDGVREDLAASDLARLMPPDTMIYVELNEPGSHLVRLAGLMGLLGADGQFTEAARGLELGDGFYLPENFVLSPALVEHLQRFRGAAVAVTSIDDRGNPQGLVALHPGDADLLRGLAETAIQFLEPAEPIQGFRTYRIESEGWIVQTARLLLIANSREQLVAAVSRLHSEEANLAKALPTELRADRESSLLFAYADGPRLMERFGSELRGEEAAIVRGVLDLQSLRSVSASIGTTDSGIQLQFRVDLEEGHRSLAYALVRTAPLSQRSLAFVPAGTAAVAIIGLNPAEGGERGEASSDGPQYVTAMDLGREFFNNIEELALFVLPQSGASRTPIPDIGIVIAAKDPAQSQLLWSRLLGLPHLFLPPGQHSEREITVAGQTGREYRFPEMPPIAALPIEERGIVIGTSGAATAALEAHASENTVLADERFRPLVERLSDQSSKALLVDVGRSLSAAAAAADGRDAEELRFAASLVDRLAVSLVTDEAPTPFVVRLEATGLPDLPKLIKAAMNQERAPRSIPAPQVRQSVESVPASR